MKAQALWIAEPGRAELRAEELPPLDADQVLVETEITAISPGTERLFFEGKAPSDLPVDSHFPGLQHGLDYPLKYGYSAVGRVVEIGSEVDGGWLEQRVFAFHPHQDLFIGDPRALIPVNPDLGAEAAAFLPNVEAALTLLHDGGPLVGERVVVHGQGVVGLLTTSLLAAIPLARLIAVEPVSERRERARQRGADGTLDPSEPEAAQRLRSLLGELDPPPRADLSFELSGAPSALDLALETTEFSGRIVVGSWYGTKPVPLNLGGSFHRNRTRLISSQVSTIDPSLTGRWTKDRRIVEAQRLLPKLQPEKLISHRVPFDRAPEAYDLLGPEATGLGILLVYGSPG